MTYLVTAYRWGWLNDHSYVVYCGPSYNEATALAEEACEDRCGKYGVVVEQYTNRKSTISSYFSSLYEENAPLHNYNLDYFHKLGHVLNNYANGQIYLMVDNVESTIEVVPDSRLVNIALIAREHYDSVTALQKENNYG